MSPTPKYIAEVRDSQEVTLLGSADLAYWKQKLLPENLIPVERDGQAQLMISAVASCWLEVRFRELSISVLANPLGHVAATADSPGLYLLTAYNSSRVFAFIERRYFQTPYIHGNVEVQCRPRASLRLQQATGEPIHAERATPVPETPQVAETWEGLIYLKPRLPKTREPRKVFYARLSGLTEISPFDPAKDTLQITPIATDPVLGWVRDSGFAGREWHIRSSATHARSNTYPRS